MRWFLLVLEETPLGLTSLKKVTDVIKDFLLTHGGSVLCRVSRVLWVHFALE